MPCLLLTFRLYFHAFAIDIWILALARRTPVLMRRLRAGAARLYAQHAEEIDFISPEADIAAAMREAQQQRNDILLALMLTRYSSDAMIC